MTNNHKTSSKKRNTISCILSTEIPLPITFFSIIDVKHIHYNFRILERLTSSTIFFFLISDQFYILPQKIIEKEDKSRFSQFYLSTYKTKILLIFHFSLSRPTLIELWTLNTLLHMTYHAIFCMTFNIELLKLHLQISKTVLCSFFYKNN